MRLTLNNWEPSKESRMLTFHLTSVHSEKLEGIPNILVRHCFRFCRDFTASVRSLPPGPPFNLNDLARFPISTKRSGVGGREKAEFCQLVVAGREISEF